MILRIGSTGSTVAQLQLTLNELARAKHFSLPDGELKGTGTFGEKTENTVKAFQKKFGLDIDGIAGAQTFEKIDQLRDKLLRAGPVTAAEKASREKLSGRLIEIARREVGVREVGGNNCGARVRDYQRATNSPLGAWPWCAAFTCWVIREWLNTYPQVRRALGWKNEEIEAKRPKTTAAFSYIDWARRFDQEILSRSAPLEAGMIAVFDFSHISFVIGASDGRNFRSIEGKHERSWRSRQHDW